MNEKMHRGEETVDEPVMDSAASRRPQKRIRGGVATREPRPLIGILNLWAMPDSN